MIKFKQLFSFKKQEVEYVFKHAQTIAKYPGLKLMQAPLPEDSEMPHSGKVLIVTPRKTGKAHLRNLLRRRIKSIFYTQNLYAKPALSALLLYNQATNLSFAELEKTILSLFSTKKP